MPSHPASLTRHRSVTGSNALAPLSTKQRDSALGVVSGEDLTGHDSIIGTTEIARSNFPHTPRMADLYARKRSATAEVFA